MRCECETSASRLLDASIGQGSELSVRSEGPSLESRIARLGARPYDHRTAIQFSEANEAALGQLERLTLALEEGTASDTRATESITRSSIEQAAQDLDLFVRLGINPPSIDSVGRHNLHVAMLATAVGANMGFDESALTEMGVGCLLHDLGMRKINQSVYRSPRLLSDQEYQQIVEHPIHTLSVLGKHLDRVSFNTRMVAYQMHERCNGSGYPRARGTNQIHQLAKIAAAADVYVALVSRRPHRPAMMPYHAVAHLLVGVKEGLFDSQAVRSLLKTISLFPIGSYVALSDGRVARVLRANPEDYCRPIVEAWRPGQVGDTPHIVALAEHPQLSIVRPLVSLSSK
jgi:HD-GYP domain-containing protein (c-di-GMP phosphodiesterase class II)